MEHGKHLKVQKQFIINMKTLATTIRKNVYLTLGALSRKNSENNNIVILCYHSVANDDWRFSVSFETLKQQVEHLLQQRQAISLEDLEQYLNGKLDINKPSFVITFDDGYKNILQTIPYFKEKGIKPTVFLLGNTEHADRYELNNSLAFLTDEEILELHNAGWTLGVHSATHADFRNLTKESIQKEISVAKTNLEKALQVKMKYFSFPKGVYSKKILEEVKKAGYTMAVSMDDGFISKKTNKYTIPRVGVDATHSIEEFKVLYSPMVTHFRGFMKQTPAAKYFAS